MSGQVDLGAIANEYIRGNAEQRRELQWQYPTQFADAAFRACIEAMAAQQTPHSNSRPPSTRPPSTTRQRIPPTERASRKTPTPKPRTSSRAGRGTPSSAATPYFSVMKTLCKGLPRAAKKMEKLQSDRQKQREKMMKEFLTKFYKGNKRLIAAARGVDLAQPQSERKSTTSTAPQHLVTVLGRIDAEMERIGVQLERGDQGDVQEEGCDGPTPDSQPTGGEAEQPKILHRCLENAQLYYDRVHRDKTDIFPTFPSEVFEDGKALLDFQWEGVRWMGSLHLNGLNGILADDMGLGKTIQIISFFNCLKYYANVAGPHLVLAPLSVLVNWRSEFTAWAPNQFRAYTITEIVSQGIAIKDVDVVICNYDFLTSGSTGARATTYRSLMRQSFVYIVADEGHRLKNKKAQTFEKVCKVKCQHRLILTGTPLQNNFLELFTLLHFVMPNVFGEHFGHDSLQRLLSNFLNSDVGEEYAEVLLSRLHQLLRPFILRRAAGEVAPELVPDLDECVISCPLSTLQDSLKNVHAKSIHKLRKIALHPYLLRQEYMIDEILVTASGKLMILDNILKKLWSCPARSTDGKVHKTIIFSQWTEVLDIIEDYVGTLRRWGYCRLDGSTSASERQCRVELFNTEKDIRIFLISKRAGAHGLNLQVADTVVLFDTDYNPTCDVQAMARVCRIGQRNDVRLFRLVVDGGLEQRIIDIATEKKRKEDLIVHAARLDPTTSLEERAHALEDALNRDRCQEGKDAIVAGTPENVTQMLARGDNEQEIFRRMDNNEPPPGRTLKLVLKRPVAADRDADHEQERESSRPLRTLKLTLPTMGAPPSTFCSSSEPTTQPSTTDGVVTAPRTTTLRIHKKPTPENLEEDAMSTSSDEEAAVGQGNSNGCVVGDDEMKGCNSVLVLDEADDDETLEFED